MKKEIPEEILRMIMQDDEIYFHRDDVCRIISRMESKCQSINAKSIVKELQKMFSCIFDDFTIDDEK